MNEILAVLSEQSLYPFAVTVVPGLVGFFVGSRSGIDRDRRIELNSVIDPIRDRLVGGQDLHTPIYGLQTVEIGRIQSRSNFWQWRRISRALNEYEKTRPDHTQDAYGYLAMTNKAAILDANKKLLCAMKRL